MFFHCLKQLQAFPKFLPLNVQVLHQQPHQFQTCLKSPLLLIISLTIDDEIKEFSGEVKTKIVALTKVLLKKAEAQAKNESNVTVDQSLQSVS